MHWRSVLLQGCLAGAAASAWAERPMVVEDASTLEPQQAQVEWGWSRDAEHRGWDATLAYSPWRAVEVEIDGGHARDRPFTSSDMHRALGGALKWVPVQAEQGLSWGLKYAYTREHLDSERAMRHVHALSGLVSWAWAAAGPRLHLNIGKSWTRGHHPVTFWGLGSDGPLAGPWEWMLEAFGEQQRKPAHQVGLRYEWTQGLKLSLAVGRSNGCRMGSVGTVWEF